MREKINPGRITHRGEMWESGHGERGEGTLIALKLDNRFHCVAIMAGEDFLFLTPTPSLAVFEQNGTGNCVNIRFTDRKSKSNHYFITDEVPEGNEFKWLAGGGGWDLSNIRLN